MQVSSLGLNHKLSMRAFMPAASGQSNVCFFLRDVNDY
jgi:hypothetical protein